jgi:hypothetical protein
MCSDFLYNLSETFLTLRRIQRDIVINIHRSSRTVPVYSYRILMKLEFPWQIFDKCSYTKFHPNLFNESPAVPRRRTDRPHMTKLTVVSAMLWTRLRKPITELVPSARVQNVLKEFTSWATRERTQLVLKPSRHCQDGGNVWLLLQRRE